MGGDNVGFIANRRKELMADGMAYQDAYEQACREKELATGVEVERTQSWAAVASSVEPRHGARDNRRINDRAQMFIEIVTDDAQCSYITSNAAFRPALERWALAEARVSLYAEWLDTHDDLTDKEARYAAEQLARWTNTAGKQADAMGLSPVSRARLGKDLAAMANNRPMQRDDELEALVAELVNASDGTPGSNVLSNWYEGIDEDGNDYGHNEEGR